MSKGQWIFPKGIVDPGETIEETAIKEAEEEAGLAGQIVGEPLGHFDDTKWGANLHVTVLLMEVSDTQADWLEADCRQRRWVAYEEASGLVSRKQLRAMLETAYDRIQAYLDLA